MATISRFRRKLLTYLITLIGGGGFLFGPSVKNAHAGDAAPNKSPRIENADSRTTIRPVAPDSKMYVKYVPDSAINVRYTLPDSRITHRGSDGSQTPDQTMKVEILNQQQEILIKMEELKLMMNDLQQKMNALPQDQ